MLTCKLCSLHILEQEVLQVEGVGYYHPTCLSCTHCQVSLSHEKYCYIRSQKIYCNKHYYKLVGRRCNGCKRIVNGEDWVRKVSAHTVYHLACFSCVVCKRQLSTGEEYSLSVNCSVHCTQHHYCGNSAASVGTGTEFSRKVHTKRLRTTFTEKQILLLQHAFSVEKNPDSTALEELSGLSCLAKRVIQVWFQNARARQKRSKLTSTPGKSSPRDEILDYICPGVDENDYHDS